MFRCIKHCDREFATQLDRVEHKLDELLKGVKIMGNELDTELDGIEAGVSAEHVDVQRIITDLEAKATDGSITDDERARLEALKAEIAADDAAINTADPAAPATPVDGTVASA